MTGIVEERICGIDIKAWLKNALEDAMNIEITEVIRAKEFERTLVRGKKLTAYCYGWLAWIMECTRDGVSGSSPSALLGT